MSGDNEAGTVGLYLINSCVAVEVLSIDWPKLTLHWRDGIPVIRLNSGLPSAKKSILRLQTGNQLRSHTFQTGDLQRSDRLQTEDLQGKR